MRKTLIISLAALTASLPLAACADGYGNDRPRYERPRHNANRGHYLGDNDQIYRDNRGRYYCKRADGSRGAIVGGLAGGVLGNVIAPNGSKTLGTILGAAGGAVAGRQIDRNNVRCE
ncbi:MAG TPA: glycine zipper 2TM domain-containing protein [Sphingobium sp.]|nr:glycine zipper 2TM domain-containing protein [Sphingobium sp.]